MTDDLKLSDAHRGDRRPDIPALGPGTMILTPEGEQPVEWLEAGARVVTRDRGVQRLSAVLRFTRGPETGAHPSLVEIGAGQLDGVLPAERMTVTATQRLLLRDGSLEVHFGAVEALVPAQAWAERDPARGPAVPIALTALVFDRPEIVQAGGLWLETFHPSAQALAGLPDTDVGMLRDVLGDARADAPAPRLCLTLEEAVLVVPPTVTGTVARARTA